MTNTNATIPNVTYAPIPSSWESVKRTLADAARSMKSYGVVKIIIMVDKAGNPIQYLQPEVKKLEPQGNGGAMCGWLEALGE